jgi:hypothetical protein
MHGLNACPLNVTKTLEYVEFSLFRILGKIFGTYSKNFIDECQVNCVGLLSNTIMSTKIKYISDPQYATYFVEQYLFKYIFRHEKHYGLCLWHAVSGWPYSSTSQDSYHKPRSCWSDCCRIQCRHLRISDSWGSCHILEFEWKNVAG